MQPRARATPTHQRLNSPTHVGIYAGVQDGKAVMVDAPHSGAEVRVEPFPDVVGQSWGGERYLGATAP